MKGMTTKLIAIVITLVIAVILLVLLWTGMYKMVPFLSQLSDGIANAMKSSFCGFVPWAAKWLMGC